MERLTRIILILSLLFVPTWALGEKMDDRANKVAVTTDEFPVSTPGGTSGMEAIADLFLLLDANLLSVVNAEAGVTLPNIPFYDSNNDGTTAQKLSCQQWSNQTTDTSGSEIADFWFTCKIDGADTEVYRFDGSDAQHEFAYPITAPAVDNGAFFDAIENVTVDLDASYSDVCEYVFANGDSAGNSTWTLPISPLCNDDVLYMKKFTFVNNDPTHLLIITPGTGDSIQVRGSQTETCAADEALYVEVMGAVLLYGRTASVWWAIPLGGTNVLCGSDPSP